MENELRSDVGSRLRTSFRSGHWIPYIRLSHILLISKSIMSEKDKTSNLSNSS
jgi:hypothetical protein